jgi:hypothetical protein
VRIGGDYIVFVFFFFLPFALDFDIAALGSVVAVGAVASDPDFAAAPPLVPLAPPVCAKAPAADKASAMAATGMISARIIISLFNECRPERPSILTDLIRPSSTTVGANKNRHSHCEVLGLGFQPKIYKRAAGFAAGVRARRLRYMRCNLA